MRSDHVQAALRCLLWIRSVGWLVETTALLATRSLWLLMEASSKRDEDIANIFAALHGVPKQMVPRSRR